MDLMICEEIDLFCLSFGAAADLRESLKRTGGCISREKSAEITGTSHCTNRCGFHSYDDYFGVNPMSLLVDTW